MKSLPFTARNERDFDEMTDRITAGLETLRKRKSLKPTQENLAKLAECSRRTLSLRRWPVEQLKIIKEGKASTKTCRQNSEPKPLQSDFSVSKQLKNYQQQNGELYSQVQDLEEERARNELIIKRLEQQLGDLKHELSEMKTHRGTKLKAVR